jgi:hypothetical protein
LLRNFIITLEVYRTKFGIISFDKHNGTELFNMALFQDIFVRRLSNIDITLLLFSTMTNTTLKVVIGILMALTVIMRVSAQTETCELKAEKEKVSVP